MPFKKGAFRLAIDLSLPVLPTTIEGTERLLPTETLDWRPGAVTLRIHPEISTLGLSSNQVDTLCDKVEAVTRGTALQRTAEPTPELQA